MCPGLCSLPPTFPDARLGCLIKALEEQWLLTCPQGVPNRARGMKGGYLIWWRWTVGGRLWGVIILQIREEVRCGCTMGVYLPLFGTHRVTGVSVCVRVWTRLTPRCTQEWENMQSRRDKLLSIHSTHWHTFIHQFTCTLLRPDAHSRKYSNQS